MYSETAGLSYENPDAPDARGDHPDDDQPAPELERVVSYPDTAAFPDLTAAVTDNEVPDDDAPDDDAPDDPAGMADAGDHDAGPPDAVMPAVGIDALLDDADDSDDDADSDSGDDADDDADPRAEASAVAMPPVDVTQQARPQLNRTTGSWPSPAGSDEEATRTRAFGTVGGGGGAGPRVSRGGQPRRQRILDLAMDPRMRYWRERLVIMVIAGVAFGILWGWIGGLTLAIIAGIAHAVWRSRTVGSIPPGIKLTRAQRITQRKLTGLQRAGYR
ncbi:MAG: Nuclease-related protein, partial [Actinomycetia bacterium]|nr:Nuclease-related protein [Actinomycetes bacterium]